MWRRFLYRATRFGWHNRATSAVQMDGSGTSVAVWTSSSRLNAISSSFPKSHLNFDKRDFAQTQDFEQWDAKHAPHAKATITSNRINDEYAETITRLNGLQSNAETVRMSTQEKGGQIPTSKDKTLKYLQRTKLKQEDLDKLRIIHVSGTKGKGSTCAITESILRSHGLRTGFFSSPHLVSVTERIRINGRPLCKQKFVDTFRRVYKLLEDSREDPTDLPAYFQFLTILCFHVFLEEKVDVVILEVGIGGELDSTNIVRNTKTVGITSLGLEHTQLLGRTLREIAWQKAGIIKERSDVFTNVTQPECLEVIRARAAERNATVHIVPPFREYIRSSDQGNLLAGLNDVIQLNGPLAIHLAYDWLNKYTGTNHAVDSLQLPLKVRDGLANCIWPGRCERVKLWDFNIHLDGAHTVESMGVCSDWFSKVSKDSRNPKVLIFNTTGDRNSRKLLEILRQNCAPFDCVCFVPNLASHEGNNKDNTSAFSVEEQINRTHLHADNWYKLCQEDNEEDKSKVFRSILECFKFLQREFGENQELDILVTGSLHLVGATVLATNLWRGEENIK